MMMENQYRKQAKKLQEEREMLAHMIGAERTKTIQSETANVTQALDGLSKLRRIFATPDIIVSISKTGIAN